MSNLSLRCIKAAFFYLAAGIFLGALFAIDRGIGGQLRPLHAELNLWGWVTLLIYGVGYHMLPRFAGQPLTRPALAEVQSWLAIGGVAAAAIGWLMLLLLDYPALARVLLTGGGLLQFAAALIFAWLIGMLLYRPMQQRVSIR